MNFFVHRLLNLSDNNAPLEEPNIIKRYLLYLLLAIYSGNVEATIFEQKDIRWVVLV
jgi:hypothetical protein